MDNYENKKDQEDVTLLSLQKYLTSYDANLSANVKVTDENTDTFNYPPSEVNDTLPLTEAKFLAIVVDNNDVYHAYVANQDALDKINTSNESHIQWYKPEKEINVNQFKGLDMWIRFEGINEMIYFMLTKYENDILSIVPSFRKTPAGDTENPDPDAVVNKEKTEIQEYDSNTEENRKTEGKLWAYINPRTMKPYADDYWFHQGEPYYIKSLTIAPKNKQIKGNKIIINADQFPGMYMMIGETYIRSQETGEDERMQIKIPLCKVSSEQTITLEASGEPTTFNLNLQVAKPRSGAMMEITAYEVATKMMKGENGCFYALDGSSEVISE